MTRRQAMDTYLAAVSEAFEAGVADGTVRPEVDPAIFFRTVCHSATALALKLIRGPLLPGEHLEDPAELHLLLDFALAYLTPDR